ncbi:hypothetical protein KCU62_g5265, partial [Aureobasidium sp. EXF-3399]
GHSQLKTGHPVRSAIHKQLNGRLVLRWVTTWESLLLYVLCFFVLLTMSCRYPSSYSLRADGTARQSHLQCISFGAVLKDSVSVPNVVVEHKSVVMRFCSLTKPVACVH